MPNFGAKSDQPVQQQINALQKQIKDLNKTVSQLSRLNGQVGSQGKAIGSLQMQSQLSNRSGNYAPAYDQFATSQGALPPGLMNFSGPFGIGPNGCINLTGFTWTNNSPAGGDIAWSAGVLTYQGVQYVIPANNTSSLFVYWALASPNVFTGAGLPLPAAAMTGDAFIVAQNFAGVYAMAVDIISAAGNRFTFTPFGLFLINSNGDPSMSIGTTAGGNGTINAWDGAGTAGANTRCTLQGNTGNFVSNGTTITVP